MYGMKVPSDIHTASTLAARAYGDETLYAQQVERVLARSFHVAGRSEALQEPASAHPLTLLPGSLDEPLVITIDDASELRALSNVCTHRGNLLSTTAGKTKQLRCGYHGRCFDLQGRCLGMPGFAEVADFPSARDNLPQVAAHVHGPLLYCALDPQCTFDAWFLPIKQRTDFMPWDRLDFDPHSERTYTFSAHWALYVDNYLEGFHIPFVHPGLAQTLHVGEYETDRFSLSNLQIGIAKEGEPAFDLPPGHVDYGKRVAAYYFWLFPCTMLNFYPWGLSMNSVLPQGPARTRVHFQSYVWKPELRQTGAGGDLHQVELEDEAVVMQVQRGVRSRLYRGGRYSVQHERNVHHFHQLLTAALAADPATEAHRTDIG